MKKVFWVILVTASVMALAACSSKSGSSSYDKAPATGKRSAQALGESDLINNRYSLKTFNGATVNYEGFGQVPSIEFRMDEENNSMMVFGTMCNIYRGPARLESGRLHAERLASTMKMCFDDTLNNAERALFVALGEGAYINVSGNELRLNHGSNEFIFERDDY